MTELIGAGPGERSAERTGYRAGHDGRSLVTRIGKLELRVPRDRDGRFSTDLFERYQRSERALVSALAEVYVQGMSTRKVKAITEELCGHAFSASTISQINKGLDEALERFALRALDEPYPSDPGCSLREGASEAAFGAALLVRRQHQGSLYPRVPCGYLPQPTGAPSGHVSGSIYHVWVRLDGVLDTANVAVVS